MENHHSPSKKTENGLEGLFDFCGFTFKRKYQMYGIPLKKELLLQMLTVTSMITWKWHRLTSFDRSSDFAFATFLYCRCCLIAHCSEKLHVVKEVEA